jgi:hypothetical protein
MYPVMAADPSLFAETAVSGSPETGAVRFDTKVALAVRDDLAVWQKLNVAAFLASAIGGSVDGVMGRPYEDADGTAYLAMCRQPITILEGDAVALASSLRRALERDLRVAVYTEEMFSTTNDDDNRAAVLAVARDRLNLVGIAVYGPRGPVDKALKSAHLHR